MLVLFMCCAVCFGQEKIYYEKKISPFGVGTGDIVCSYKFSGQNNSATVMFSIERNGRKNRGMLYDITRADMNNLSAAFKNLNKQVSSDKKYKKFVDSGLIATEYVKGIKVEISSDGINFKAVLSCGDCIINFKREELSVMADIFTEFADRYADYAKEYSK